MNRALLLTAILTLASTACGPRNDDESATASAIPATGGYVAGLGSGFNQEKGRFAGFPCVKGTVTPETEATSTFSSDSNLTFESLAERLFGHIDITIPITPVISGTGEFELTNEFSSNEYSQTIVNSYEVHQGSEAFRAEDVESQKLDAMDSWSGVADDTRTARRIDLCGTEYVSRVDRGALVTSMMKIEFRNSRDMRKWSGGVGVSLFGGFAHAKLNIDKIDEDIRRSTVVTVAVTQRGGDPEGLLKILPDDAGETEILGVDGQWVKQPGIGVMTCTLDNMAPCIEFYRDILAYMKDDVPYQIHGGKNGAILGFETTPYRKDHAERLALEIPMDAEQLTRLGAVRAGLSQIYRVTVQDLNRLRLLRTFFIGEFAKVPGELAASADFQDVLRAEADTLSNQRLVAKQIARCWDEPHKCLSLDPANLEGFRAVDPWIFDVRPMRFIDWCAASAQKDVLSDDEIRTVEAMKAASGKSDCVAAAAVLEARESLVLVNRQIISLEPLASLRNLKELDLRQNLISDVSPLGGLRRLEKVNLGGNLIDSLAGFLVGPSRPKTLILAQNLVSDLRPLGNPGWKSARVVLDKNELSGRLPPLGPAPIIESLSLIGNDLADDVCPFSTQPERCQF